MTEATAFWILSAVAVASALVAVRKRNLVHGVFALLVFFAALAGHFLLLLAEFLAAAQVLVYIGAVGILLLFAVMLTERVTGEGRRIMIRGSIFGTLAAAAVFFVLIWPTLSMLKSPEKNTHPLTTRELGERLMDPYAITLEILALLLTAALVGAVAIAQGRLDAPEKEEPK